MPNICVLGCLELPNLYWVPLWCGGFLTDNNTTPTNLFHIVLVVGWVTAFYLPTDEWWGKHVQTGEQRPPNFSVSHTFLTEGVVLGFWNFAHSLKCQKYSFMFPLYNYKLYLCLILMINTLYKLQLINSGWISLTSSGSGFWSHLCVQLPELLHCLHYNFYPQDSLWIDFTKEQSAITSPCVPFDKTFVHKNCMKSYKL